MKYCYVCKITKPKSEFYKSKHKSDGRGTECKSCTRSLSRAYRRSKLGLIANMYSNHKSRSKKRGHLPPVYTRGELTTWVFAQDNFESLYTEWVASDFERYLVPSVDRLDDAVGYTLSNIRLVTWWVNNRKARDDIKAGKLISKNQRRIVQLDLDLNLIAEYPSYRCGQRATGFTDSNISAACMGLLKYNIYKNFVWMFFEDYLVGEL